MANNVRVGTQVTGVGKAGSDLDRLRDKFEKLQRQGAKGFAIGAGAAVTAKGLSLLEGAVGSVTDAIGDSLQAASNLQQSTGAVESVFGRAADKVEAFAKRADDALGLSKNAVNEMAAVIGAQLQGMGFEVDAAADKTFELQQRAADMAATFGGTTKDAIMAITALMRGERDPIERYGVSIKAADVEARILAKGLDTSTTAAKKNSEAIAGMELLMESTAKTTGQFAREMDSAAGSGQRLNARLENMSAEFGEKILPIQVAALEALIFALDRTEVPLERMKAAAERGSQAAAAQFRYLQNEAERLGITVEEAWERANAGTLHGVSGMIAAMSDLRNFTGKAKDDVHDAADGMGDAAEDLDKRSTKAYRHVMKTLGDVADAYDETWSDLAGTAEQAAEDIFGPMERRAELSANRLAQSAAMGDINKPRQKGESALDFEQRIGDARQELAGLQRDYFTLMAEMAGRGELTTGELSKLTQALKEQLKTAANEEAVSILNLITLLDRLRAKSQGVFRVVGLNLGDRTPAGSRFSGARASGGPVAPGGVYKVGERGPEELHMGNVGGFVTPGVSGGGGAAEKYLPIIAGQLARLTAREPHAARPMTARGDLARQAALMPGGRL